MLFFCLCDRDFSFPRLLRLPQCNNETVTVDERICTSPKMSKVVLTLVKNLGGHAEMKAFVSHIYYLIFTLSFLQPTPSFSAAAHGDVIFAPLLYGMYYLACALYIYHKEEIRMAAAGAF